MNKELPKVYEPQQVESRIYQMWEDHDCFKGVEDSKKKSFSIVMPPPNVTGQLHMGHALDCTLQDILTRFKRMQGYACLLYTSPSGYSSFNFSMIRRVDALYRMAHLLCTRMVLFYHEFCGNEREKIIAFSGQLCYNTVSAFDRREGRYAPALSGRDPSENSG